MDEKQFREGMIKRDEKRPEKGKDLTNKKCKKGEARVGRERERGAVKKIAEKKVSGRFREN